MAAYSWFCVKQSVQHCCRTLLKIRNTCGRNEKLIQKQNAGLFGQWLSECLAGVLLDFVKKEYDLHFISFNIYI